MKDFLVAHYTCGPRDTEFWKYIDSGATSTDFVRPIPKCANIEYPMQLYFPPKKAVQAGPYGVMCLQAQASYTSC